MAWLPARVPSDARLLEAIDPRDQHTEGRPRRVYFVRDTDGQLFEQAHLYTLDAPPEVPH